MHFTAQVQIGRVEADHCAFRVLAAQDEYGADWIIVHAEDASDDQTVCLLRPDEAEDLAGAIASAVERLRHGHLKVHFSRDPAE